MSGLDVTALQDAQVAFNHAQNDFLQGQYNRAARGFHDAFAAAHAPQFLYDAGVSYFMKGMRDGDAGAYRSAVDAYTRYLASDPIAPGVAETIAVVQPRSRGSTARDRSQVLHRRAVCGAPAAGRADGPRLCGPDQQAVPARPNIVDDPARAPSV